MPYDPRVCPKSSFWFSRPISAAGFPKPSTPIVELTKKLLVAWPANLTSPCKRWLGIDNKVATLEVKFPVPFLIGSGSLLYAFATGSKIILSNPWLNLKIPLLTFSKHSLSLALALTEKIKKIKHIVKFIFLKLISAIYRN